MVLSGTDSYSHLWYIRRSTASTAVTLLATTKGETIVLVASFIVLIKLNKARLHFLPR